MSAKSHKMTFFSNWTKRHRVLFCDQCKVQNQLFNHLRVEITLHSSLITNMLAASIKYNSSPASNLHFLLELFNPNSSSS
mmetsp:Transcript_26102/g.62903  ORF Transcript_26102/g.62903 Transcript_26102/m.62903 type:complete len:80 (-) Transcript_26102:500-739(-)